ncbi:MAG: FkbM family methyltransferase [Methanoregula sp.]|nr:FkbM family methyltransferase [Methanoregula sp.]
MRIIMGREMNKILHYYHTIRTKLGIPTIVEEGGIKFYCPSFTEQWLAETMFTKEPETIAWIDTLSLPSTFWDFGANVGIYSIYAAKKGHFVVCFEPSSREFKILQRNIELNLVWADVHKVLARDTTDYTNIARPDYIKIDTDGFELPILKGLVNILPSVKELSIELEPGSRESIVAFMREHGFTIKSEGSAEMLKGTIYEKFSNAIFAPTRE